MESNRNIGAIVIGRNEGERLRRCLNSVVGQVKCIVYVDSGSTDNSLTIARELGVEIVRLDSSQPFTAARARNSGVRHLSGLDADLDYIQFVDGDCEVVAGWINAATAFLDQNPDYGVVCGRRRERYPSHSVYNRLCDIEWNTPVGEARACGGDALFRSAAFASVKGFRDDLIAGEERELCVRLRRSGWRVWRLDVDMTLHDAAMARFGQWWRRSFRGGYAYAEGASLHGSPPERHCVRESRRILFWGLALPLSVAVLSLLDPGFLALLLLYPLQVIRIALRGSGKAPDNWIYAFFVTLGKFPEVLGQLKFFFNKIKGTRSMIIEYKG